MTVSNQMEPWDVRALLPFHVNGTLVGEDRARVDAALRDDPALGQEAALLSRLHDNLQRLTPPPSPGEFGLARLMRDIDREQQSPPSRAAFAAWGNHRTLIAAGLSAAAALVVGLALTLAPDDREPGYTQAAGMAGAGDLGITFQSGTAVDVMTDLLLRHDLVVVDGPSALGLYWVSAPKGTDISALSATLRADVDIVESVSLSE